MRGMWMLPVERRPPRPNLPSRQRCVVSSCVSTTMDKKCSWTALPVRASAETLGVDYRSRGRDVEEAHLADDGRAHELIMLIHLRANLEAVPTCNAIRKRIALLLNFWGNARAFAEIVSAVDGNPGLHALEAFKHELPVNREIAHQRKLRHRLDSNGLFKFIGKPRTRRSPLC